MKNILLRFSENLLSRADMQKIKGGYEEEGALPCKRCKDDSNFLCSLKVGGGCECRVSGLSAECQTTIQ